MMPLFVYVILSAAMFYLGSRAQVTSFLWRNYPRSLAAFMDCAACTGFWWGVTWAMALGRSLGWEVVGLDPMHPATPILVGLCSLVLTPVAAGLMQVGLDHLGSVDFDSDADLDSED